MSAINLRTALLSSVMIGGALVADRVVADAIVVTQAMKAATIAEILIDDRQVLIELEVGARDLVAFRNVLPDELFTRLTGEKVPLAERQQTFLREDWVIQADGVPLEGKFQRVLPSKRVTRDEITGDPLAAQPESPEIVIRVTLRYSLPNQPQTLSLFPPQDELGAVAATIGFVAYHRGVAVNDFRYLSQNEILRLDWTDPWYTRFERKTLRRRYFAPAAAFLYIENFEVRKEIIFRPRDLQQWVDLGLTQQQVIPADSRAAVCQQAAEFLGQHTPVRIDGQLVAGKLDRVHFVSRTLRTSQVVEPGVDVDMDTALIGAIYIYPVDSLPQKVSMGWDLFNERISQIPTVATDEAGGMPSLLEPNAPILEWTNFLTNPTTPAFEEISPPRSPVTVPLPWLSVVCLAGAVWLWRYGVRSAAQAGSPSPVPAAGSLLLLTAGVSAAFIPGLRIDIPITRSREISNHDAQDITYSLLHNVYRAFDYRDENAVYDVLDRSVSGELLTQIYLETRQSLTLASQGGARVKVNQVELTSCRSQRAKTGCGFVANCQWIVTGSVGHWGHIHQRKNQYHGKFVVKAIDDQWKLTDMELLGEERL